MGTTRTKSLTPSENLTIRRRSLPLELSVTSSASTTPQSSGHSVKTARNSSFKTRENRPLRRKTRKETLLRKATEGSTQVSSQVTRRVGSLTKRRILIARNTTQPARNSLLRAVHLVRLSTRSEEHTSELQSRVDLVCRLLLEKK